MPRLVHVGAVIADVAMTVPTVPASGGAVLATSSRTRPGGGFSVMAAAKRAGMDVVYAGAHGTGPYGEMARAALRAEGVELAHAPKQGADTGFCVALVEPGAEPTFVTSLGAESDLSAAELAALRPAADDTVYLVGYSLLPGPSLDPLLAWIADLPDGVRLVFDPAPVVDELAAGPLGAVLQRTDVLSPNAAEAAVLTGRRDPLAAAAALSVRIRPGGLTAVRDGAGGCVLAQGTEPPARIPGVPVTAVDTTGAGDTHVGTLIAALDHGADPLAAARRANAAAAFSVTRPGPGTAPTAAELTAFTGRQHTSAPVER